MKGLITIILIAVLAVSCTKTTTSQPITIVEDKKTRHYVKFSATLGFGSGCWTYIGICHGRLEHNIGGLNVAEWKMYDIVEDVWVVTVNNVKHLKFAKEGDIYKKAVNKDKLYIGEISIQEGIDFELLPTTYDVITTGSYAYIKIS